MRAALMGALVLVAAAAQGHAGAWPREPGTVFLSFSSTLSTGARTLLAPMTDIRSGNQVFAEYGLTDVWTLGLDATRATGEGAPVSAGLVSLRRPVWRGSGGGIAAAELGVGVLEDGDGVQGRLRPGLSWGRGFETARGDGWLGVESSVELRLPSGDTAVKADFTAGLKPTDNWMLIAQVQTGLYPRADPIVRLAPSVVRRLGETTHAQLGLIGSVAGDDAVGLKLALWFSF